MVEVSDRLAVVVGTLVTALFFYASGKIIVISQSYAMFSGVLGGTITGFLVGGKWSDSLEQGFIATVLAVPVVVALFTLYDIAMTTKYDLVLLPSGTGPTGLLSKVIVYGIHEIILSIFVFAVFPLGGIAGGLIGWIVSQSVRSIFRDIGSAPQ